MRDGLDNGSDDRVLLSDDSLAGDEPSEDDSLLRAIAAAPIPRLRPWLAPGTLIDGAYRIESQLGSGAMGTVYVATDLALDRRIALKLHSNTHDDARTSLMWREAKAMARLSDPNVVAVHEVGVHEGRVYIAMELVEGSSAREWMKTPHDWREILDVFIQAASGLAAAHRVGLVHRDFKPANLLIERTSSGIGRVRVADFGLARAAGEGGAAIGGSSGQASVSGSPSLDQRMTQTGVVVGTPAYMAPEQHDGRVDHRSDQYAFFVTMHEALYGVRPFPGASTAEIAAAERAGELPAAPADRPVPPWLRQVVLRGLRVRPEERHADMDAVVGALRSDPTRRRRMQIAVAGGVGVMAGLLGVIVHLAGRASGPDCDAQAAVIGDSWNDDVRARVREAMLATTVTFAADTWSRVEPQLDAWAQSWSDAARAACARTDVALGGQLHEARLRCLAHRRRAFDALLEVLAVADATTVERGASAVTGLPGVASCSDVDHLAADVEPPTDPELAAAVEQVRATLSRARALDQAGGFAQGLEVAAGALGEARALAWTPLVAEAQLVHGTLAISAGKFDVAESSLRESYAEALASRHDGVAADAASLLTFVVGDKLARTDAGLEWSYHATAQVRRLGEGERREARLLDHIGAVRRVRGELDQALQLYSRSLAISEAMLGPDHLDVARTLRNLADVHTERAEYPVAIAQLERVLRIRERALGPDHPAVAQALSAMLIANFRAGDVAAAEGVARRVLALRERVLPAGHPDIAGALANLGNLLERRGQYDEALALLLRALDIETAAHGERHPDVASTLESVGNVHLARGDYAQAEVFYRRTLAIREQVLGVEHPHVALTLQNLAQVLDELERGDEGIQCLNRALAIQQQALGAEHPGVAAVLQSIGNAELFAGDLDSALEHHRRSLVIREAALGTNHADTAHSHTNIGNTFEAQRRWGDALVEHQRALKIVEAVLDAQHPDRALAHFNLGQAYLGLDRPADAVRELERSLALREPMGTAPAFLADVRFELARALVAAKGDRERALELAAAARDGYGPTPSEQRLRATVVAWLDTQRSAQRR